METTGIAKSASNPRIPVCVRFIPLAFEPPCPPMTASALALCAARRKSPKSAKIRSKLFFGVPLETTSTILPLSRERSLVSCSRSSKFTGTISPSTPLAGVEPVQPMASTCSLWRVGESNSASAVPRFHPRPDLIAQLRQILKRMRIHHSFARNFRERRLGAIFVRSLEPVVAKRALRRTQESPSQHRCPNTRQPLSHPLVSSAPQRASQAITSDAPPSSGFSSPSCVPIVRGTANSGCAPFVECGGLVYPVYPELRGEPRRAGAFTV